MLRWDAAHVNALAPLPDALRSKNVAAGPWGEPHRHDALLIPTFLKCFQEGDQIVLVLIGQVKIEARIIEIHGIH